MAERRTGSTFGLTLYVGALLTMVVSSAAEAPRREPSRGPGGMASAPCPGKGCPDGRLTLSRATPVHLLPSLASSVVFVAKPGETMQLLTPRIGRAGFNTPADRSCCSDPYYDPDQQTDVIDRVGEGYIPIFHASASRAAGFSPAPGSPVISSTGEHDCDARQDRDGCGDRLTLREPGTLGHWVQAASADGTRRGWVLLSGR